MRAADSRCQGVARGPVEWRREELHHLGVGVQRRKRGQVGVAPLAQTQPGRLQREIDIHFFTSHSPSRYPCSAHERSHFWWTEQEWTDEYLTHTDRRRRRSHRLGDVDPSAPCRVHRRGRLDRRQGHAQAALRAARRGRHRPDAARNGRLAHHPGAARRGRRRCR